MYLLKVIILGIIQGLTEFLPISSSGHLVLAAEILNFHEEGIAFEVFVHVGTLFSVLIAFRLEIIQMIRAPFEIYLKKYKTKENTEFLHWDYMIILATIPAGIVGLLFKDEIEKLFSSVLLVIFMLFITALFMYLSKFISPQNKRLTAGRAFLIGIAQAIAILPGISRSGSTIVTGMATGIDREKAAKFSFILSVPAIIGALVLKTKDLLETNISLSDWGYLLVGTITAAIFGYLAIIWLLDIVRKGKLEWFGVYCFIIASIGLIWIL